MPSFVESIKKIELDRRKTAVFRKVLLHVHSPFSYDWTDEGKGIEFEQQIDLVADRLKASGLEIISITDHMKYSLACSVSARLKANGEAPVILPGVELKIRCLPPNNKYCIHLVAIFPPDTSPEQISRILPAAMPSEDRRSGKEEIPDADIAEVIATIRAVGGLCIAAHVDTDRGVRCVFRQSANDALTFYSEGEPEKPEEAKEISEEAKDWIRSLGFDAIEVGKESDRKHYSLAGPGNTSIPVILTSDPHDFSKILDPSRVTFVKMQDTGFEGLCRAFKFPDGRIRFPSDVPDAPCPRIIGLEVTGTGFFKALTLGFSDNLTCLIGPRGSGKSTIVEALRYVFGRNRDLGSLESSTLERNIRSMQASTLKDSVIRAFYLSESGAFHILEAVFDPNEDCVTRVYDRDGNPVAVNDVEKSGLYPIKLFGWSEIEYLGRNTSLQRSLLDGQVAELVVLLKERDELRDSLRSKREEIEILVKKLNSLLEKNHGEVKSYQTYKAEFDRLNTEEAKELFNDLDKTKKKISTLLRLESNTDSLIADLEKQASLDLLRDITGFEEQDLIQWWNGVKSQLGVSNVESKTRALVQEAIEELKAFRAKVAELHQAFDKELEKCETDLREKVRIDPKELVAAEQRTRAQDRLSRTVETRRQYSALWERLMASVGQWRDACRSLLDKQAQVSRMRSSRKSNVEQLLNDFRTKEMQISIRHEPNTDKKSFVEFLSEGFFVREIHGNYKQKRWPEKIAQSLTPLEIALAVLENADGKMFSQPLSISDSDAAQLINSLKPFAHDEGSDLDCVHKDRLAKILRMAEVPWDDLYGIALNGTPVENMSPGQRSSAMVPLIAITGKEPLIIDQPEDNLDNRLVGKVISNVLAWLKERRQVIVSTHNPNIVVSGDAEQVVVLEARNDSEGLCSDCGSIDNGSIVQGVIDIMEGGKEAFIARKTRYRF